VILATELAFLQKALLTTSLDGLQWLACLGLALILPIVVEVDKWIRRRRLPAPPPPPPTEVVDPARALTSATA
jgi:Ca2+-transporting ATPase